MTEDHTQPESAAEAFYRRMRTRRSVRVFSDRPVSGRTVEWLVRTAGAAPSGANSQPWRFVCVRDGDTKRRIRAESEKREHDFYERRAGDTFLAALEPLETNADKRFLEDAPWLVAVFELTRTDTGSPVYYPGKSVGIAVGFLLAAAHHAGLATLVYTPSPMDFLGPLLKRPPNERPYCIVPLGYPAESYRPPERVVRKPLSDIIALQE